jgi:GGDEF domain-containing protein/tetratricopeptide (TPR) repeat protein
MTETTKRVDRAEIAKQIERAEKLLQRGKTADALDGYIHALAGDPSNDTVRQMAADLCLSLQRIPDAVKLLGELFERQMEAGDATRASLTYKKLARFVNPTWEQKLRFGQILENSNRKLAIETYQNAFEELTQQGRKPESLKALQRSVNLDPSEQNLQRLGELSAEVGDHKSAAAAFSKLADVIKTAGGDASQWIERAYTEDSSDSTIALAYGKSLLAQTQVGAAIFVLEPLANVPSASLEFSETYAKALLAANRLTEAEVILWKLFEENPARMDDISNLIGQFIDANQDVEAVDLARKLEQSQRRKGERRAFLATMQEIVAKHRASPEILEFLSEQFNASNRETDYCQTLIKLFDLHYGMGNFAKAAEALDRAAEVDAYEPGHQKRLESLRGKIDESRYKVIASRFSSLAVSAEPKSNNEEKSLGSATLQDLMLQVEILIQYGMRTKAIERLQRIQELFPREEERNENLQQLYLTAGLTPQYANAAPRPAASAPVAVTPTAPVAQSNDANDVGSFTRVAEITRKLYRQSNADAVLSTTVNEIGEQWKVTRCVAAMRKPGLKPTAIKEYCSGTAKLGNASALEKVVAATQDLAVSRGTLTITDAQASPELASIREALAELGVSSLLALPLTDGPDHVGVLLLMNSTPRGWNSNDVVVLKTISEQIVIALNNAGLRRLVKSLSVTDEKSGLLKRASYLDLLMAETKRSVQNSTPVTILLMRLGERAVMLKEFGEAAVEAAMQQIGLLFAANIRQNDLAFRYETTTVAIVLGETGEKEAMMAVDKLRKLLGDVHIAEKPASIPFAAGVAEAVVRPQFDPVDIVTEVINRAEQALDSAIAQGPGKVVIQGASISSAAVA